MPYTGTTRIDAAPDHINLPAFSRGGPPAPTANFAGPVEAAVAQLLPTGKKAPPAVPRNRRHPSADLR
jgi:hypothetical protein